MSIQQDIWDLQTKQAAANAHAETPLHDETPLRNVPAPLRDYALAALAGSVIDLLAGDPQLAEHRFLLAHLHTAGGLTGWRTGVQEALAAGAGYGCAEDRPLLALAQHLGLSAGEVLAVALAAAVEEEPMVGRVIAYLQQPMGGARPTLGLLATALRSELEARKEPASPPPPGGALPPLLALLIGPAVSSGLLALSNEQAPLPERSVVLPQPLALALHGADGAWPGSLVGLAAPLPLPPSVQAEAERQARALAGDTAMTSPGRRELRLLVVRSGSPAEGQAVAAAVAAALQLQPLYLQITAPAAGLASYCHLRGRLPVFCTELPPGEHKTLPTIPGYSGPVLAVCGLEGSLELEGAVGLSWTPPIPTPAERELLWRQALPPASDTLAGRLAGRHRHSSGRIAQLGRLATHQAHMEGRAAVEAHDVYAAAWAGDGAGLETLAQPLPERIGDEALVAAPFLQRDLNALLARCLARDGLVDNLGASARARYRPGVRALFVGASGAGKTLAVGWLATQLHMPLYRVDLAAVTSKYIGETEKNLAQLLGRAEQSEVILLFDEADSLFGKRTDVQQANDRFANAQTNYLLQRIESYDGICVLTSNSRSRFDQSFTRRLDVIIEFPTPGPQERRALWLSHLGSGHTLAGQDINRLAAVADLAGGHIRNVVLTAAVLAHSAGRPITYADVLGGLADEYRKLGRQLPADL